MTIRQRLPTGQWFNSGYLVRNAQGTGWLDCEVRVKLANGSWFLVYTPPLDGPGGPGGIPP